MKQFRILYSTKVYYGVTVVAKNEGNAVNLVEQGYTKVISKAERLLRHGKLESMPEVYSVQEVI